MGARRHGAALSCRFPIIVIQESTKPLTLLYSSSRFSLRFHRHDQPVSKTLMVSFHVIVLNKLTNGIPQRIFTKEDHPLQATFRDAPDKPLRISIGLH